MDESVSAACASAEMTTGWTQNIAEVLQMIANGLACHWRCQRAGHDGARCMAGHTRGAGHLLVISAAIDLWVHQHRRRALAQ